jgi:carboxypeptidase Taq
MFIKFFMKQSTLKAYEQLSQRNRECVMLGTSNALLEWDMQTYMPPRAARFRADQSAYLAGQSHRLWTAVEVGDWISECEDEGFPENTHELVNIRQWRKSYDRSTKLSVELVERLKRETSLGHETWVAARTTSDFSVFRPSLERIVSINREMAQCWGYGGSPYNALLEGYETEAKTEEIKVLFERLAPRVTALLSRALAELPPKPVLPSGIYPKEQQEVFNRKIAEALGFDFQAGRIDTTAHPFCTTTGCQDVRLTTRYDETDFTSSLYGIIHETGHGLYEQGLKTDDFGKPMGEAVSLGIHESQSRLWENQVCRRPEFWEFWFEEACRCFPQLKQSSPQKLARYVNHVERSFIRVEADEVTYDLHVILRFLLEVDLFEGRLEVADIPEAWNERFNQMLGRDVPDDARGCLQDVHWSMGSFGYFATYTLGSLNAAQLFAQASKENPHLNQHLLTGQYGSLLEWLRENVHQHGQRYNPQELMRLATGSGTSEEAFLKHLEQKIQWLAQGY